MSSYTQIIKNISISILGCLGYPIELESIRSIVTSPCYIHLYFHFGRRTSCCTVVIISRIGSACKGNSIGGCNSKVHIFFTTVSVFYFYTISSHAGNTKLWCYLGSNYGSSFIQGILISSCSS